jgi:hypothetical protein
MYGRSTAAPHLGKFDLSLIRPNSFICFSDSSHRFFSAVLSFFQFDHRKHAALSSTVHGATVAAHRFAAGFRINFL